MVWGSLVFLGVGGARGGWQLWGFIVNLVREIVVVALPNCLLLVYSVSVCSVVCT